jgi:2'-5' RNA ligase
MTSAEPTPVPSVRAFVAIELPGDARAFCQAAIDRARQLLGPDARAVRWTDPEGSHLTLKFLGAVPATQVSELTASLGGALADQTPFELAIGRSGVFPSSRAPRVLWLALLGDLAVLQACQARVESATVPHGYPSEKRPFQAHLTLGRVRDTASARELAAIGRLPATWPTTASAAFRVISASLMQSLLGPGGARYSRLAELEFGS